MVLRMVTKRSIPIRLKSIDKSPELFSGGCYHVFSMADDTCIFCQLSIDDYFKFLKSKVV